MILNLTVDRKWRQQLSSKTSVNPGKQSAFPTNRLNGNGYLTPQWVASCTIHRRPLLRMLQLRGNVLTVALLGRSNAGVTVRARIRPPKRGVNGYDLTKQTRITEFSSMSLMCTWPMKNAIITVAASMESRNTKASPMDDQKRVSELTTNRSATLFDHGHDYPRSQHSTRKPLQFVPKPR